VGQVTHIGEGKIKKKNWFENPKEKNHLRELVTDRSIMLRWILKK